MDGWTADGGKQNQRTGRGEGAPPPVSPRPRERTQASGRGINTRVIAGAPSAAVGPVGGRARRRPVISPRRRQPSHHPPPAPLGGRPPSFEGSRGTRGGSPLPLSQREAQTPICTPI